MHAKDLPLLRHRMIEYLKTPKAQQLWATFVNSGAFYLGHLPSELTPSTAAQRLRDDELLRLHASELYFVSKTMTNLAKDAAESLPAFHLTPEDLPSTYGLLVWDGVVGTREERGITAEILSVAWGPTEYAYAETANREISGPGVWLSFYSDNRTAIAASIPDAESMSEAQRREVISWVGPLSFEQEILVPFLPEGDDWGEYLHNAEGAQDALKSLLTTWLLMQQSITDITPVQAPPRDRRLLQKRGGKPAPVRYIALHGATHDRTASAHGKVQHQFPVRGHWRNQWYPSQERHRPIWIDPHWKGPAGAPIISPERVYTLRR